MLMDLHRLIVAIAVFLALCCGPTIAQQTAESRGEALVLRHCAMCHATGRAVTSPLAPAPPFRTLGLSRPIESLEEPLRNGALLGHPAMPGFSFSPRQASEIVRYLQSIQDR
jgi:mono/diheme cytochrome c family protein